MGKRRVMSVFDAITLGNAIVGYEAVKVSFKLAIYKRRRREFNMRCIPWAVRTKRYVIQAAFEAIAISNKQIQKQK